MRKCHDNDLRFWKEFTFSQSCIPVLRHVNLQLKIYQYRRSTGIAPYTCVHIASKELFLFSVNIFGLCTSWCTCSRISLKQNQLITFWWYKRCKASCIRRPEITNTKFARLLWQLAKYVHWCLRMWRAVGGQVNKFHRLSHKILIGNTQTICENLALVRKCLRIICEHDECFSTPDSGQTQPMSAHFVPPDPPTRGQTPQSTCPLLGAQNVFDDIWHVIPKFYGGGGGGQ